MTLRKVMEYGSKQTSLRLDNITPPLSLSLSLSLIFSFSLLRHKM